MMCGNSSFSLTLTCCLCFPVGFVQQHKVWRQLITALLQLGNTLRQHISYFSALAQLHRHGSLLISLIKLHEKHKLDISLLSYLIMLLSDIKRPPVFTSMSDGMYFKSECQMLVLSLLLVNMTHDCSERFKLQAANLLKETA